MSKLEKLEKAFENAKENEKAYARFLLDEYLNLSNFEQKLEEYEDFFGEAFPVAETMGISKGKIIELIDNALENKVAYKSVEGRIY